MATIKILGLVSGGPTEYDGEYVLEYDPGRSTDSPLGFPMRCHLRTTADRESALQLPHQEAFELWRSVDPREPTRPDGRPNRPLTAFSVEIER